MYGDLQGCWYTKSESEPLTKDNGQPSGIYQERGEEIFVELDDDKVETGNTFKTTYHFTSKYDPEFFDGDEFGAEIHGRCRHPIVEGTGVFSGGGLVNFKDDVVTGNNTYRGHINP
jgi:hypothetical protein